MSESININQSYQGVYKATRKNGTIYYRASFTYKNKHISLGSFDTPEAAHRAYISANLLVSSSTIGIDDYSDSQILPFDKWVVLINFRDNDIYFSNPIYIRKKYFSYYLNPSYELKFSIDDLFYYSSHKIMRRGGHLFVSDYGMQVSIASRYGIKPYAVKGRDYLHRNGDELDYCYENIEVHNKFHGVKYTTHYGHPAYQSAIHIHGNFVIGYFNTSLEAAIAYNKAIDVLAANGLNKAFIANYIDDIPAKMYAEIYSGIKIPQKITELNNL